MLGLDDAPSWVIVSEHHLRAWPDSGLGAGTAARRRRFIPGVVRQAKAKFVCTERGRRTCIRAHHSYSKFASEVFQVRTGKGVRGGDDRGRGWWRARVSGRWV